MIVLVSEKLSSVIVIVNVFVVKQTIAFNIKNKFDNDYDQIYS